jgi:DNA-binding MarR family transcriptional regulator
VTAAPDTAPETTAGNPVVGSAAAAELMAAFVTVAKRLQRAPLPVSSHMMAGWRDNPPAPRHVAALLHVVADERMSVTTLAERLGVSLATASQVVTDLESLELVERVDDPADRRRTLIQVAPAHRELTAALLETRLRPVQRALGRMRPAEQRAFVRGLHVMAEELDA